MFWDNKSDNENSKQKNESGKSKKSKMICSKNVWVDSQKEYENNERLQYEIEINRIKDDPNLLQEKSKNILKKASKIFTSDGIQKHGKLPPINQKSNNFNRDLSFKPQNSELDANGLTSNYYDPKYGNIYVIINIISNNANLNLDFNKEKSVKILDQTDDMNSVELNPDEFRNTYKSNFGRSDITSEFDLATEGRFKSSNLQFKMSYVNYLNDQTNSIPKHDTLKDHFASMMPFNDIKAEHNYFPNTILEKNKQRTKPFLIKKHSDASKIEVKDESFTPFSKVLCGKNNNYFKIFN